VTEPLFHRRGAIGLAAGVLLSLLTFVGIRVFGGDSLDPPSFGPGGASTSALGHQAFLEVLRAVGVPVTTSRYDSARRAGSGALLVVAEPELGADDLRSRNRLAQMFSTGGTVLLVLPRRNGKQDARDEHFVERTWERDDDAAERILDLAGARRRGAASNPRLGRRLDPKAAWVTQGHGPSPTLPDARVLRESVVEETLVEAGRDVLVGRLPPSDESDTEIWVLSDPDLIATHGLVQGDNAALAVGLVDFLRAGRPVVVDETTHGRERPPDVWREMFAWPLVLVVVSAGLAALLGLWAGIGRFGAPPPLAPPVPAGKRFLVDHTADLLEQGGHAGEALARYFDTTVAEVSKGTHVPAGLTAVEREEWLVRIEGARGTGPRLASLRADVAAAGKRRDPRRVVEVAQSVRRWRQEMIDGPVRHP